MTEDQLEHECLGWLRELGYTQLYGPDIAHAGSDPLCEVFGCGALVAGGPA